MTISREVPQLTSWMSAHIIGWAVLFAFTSGVRFLLIQVIADGVNAIACPLLAGEGVSDYCFHGMDIGLAVGGVVSVVIFLAILGIVGGLGEWLGLRQWGHVSRWWLILTMVVPLIPGILVAWLHPFVGIINVIIGGIDLNLANAVLGAVVGSIIGLGVGLVSFVILQQVKRSAG